MGKFFYTGYEVAQIVKKEREEAVAEAFADLAKIDVMRDSIAVDFDFNNSKIEVFSVERMKHNTKDEVTVIGYTQFPEIPEGEDKPKTVHQWFIFCSRNQHNALAEKFKIYLTNKKNTKTT